jgi:hypothetical protein
VGISDGNHIDACAFTGRITKATLFQLPVLWAFEKVQAAVAVHVCDATTAL